MVCTFFFITVPLLLFRGAYWLFQKLMGRSTKPQAEKEIDNKANSEETEKKKGFCPYHFFMALIGRPVKPKAKTEKKNDEA